MAEGPISYLPERRQQSRRPLRATAHLLIASRQSLSVRVLDVGVSGISIVTAANAPVDAECGLRFSIPWGLQTLCIEAAVSVAQSVFSRNDDGFRVSLRFKSLTDEQANALRNFVAS